MDRVSRLVRSRIMASVKTKNTLPEMALRQIIHRMGFRYALHRKDLPGRPDLVFVRMQKIIFVHGCFWHGHRCRHGHLPKSRLSYWRSKIEINRRRDSTQKRRLTRMGWHILVVWQCELKDAVRLNGRLREFLNGIRKTDRN